MVAYISSEDNFSWLFYPQLFEKSSMLSFPTGSCYEIIDGMGAFVCHMQMLHFIPCFQLPSGTEGLGLIKPNMLIWIFIMNGLKSIVCQTGWITDQAPCFADLIWIQTVCICLKVHQSPCHSVKIKICLQTVSGHCSWLLSFDPHLFDVLLFLVQKPYNLRIMFLVSVVCNFYINKKF